MALGTWSVSDRKQGAIIVLVLVLVLERNP